MEEHWSIHLHMAETRHLDLLREAEYARRLKNTPKGVERVIPFYNSQIRRLAGFLIRLGIALEKRVQIPEERKGIITV